MTGPAWVEVRSARRELDDEVLAVLEEFEPAGWRLRRQGHKFYFYCPCGQSKVRINGSPQNAGTHARRVRREIGHCPDRHALDG